MGRDECPATNVLVYTVKILVRAQVALMVRDEAEKHI